MTHPTDPSGADPPATSEVGEPGGRRDHTLLVCYDIVDDRVRADVALALGQFGPRVQLSTFELRVRDRRELDELIASLTAMIQPECDQIRVYNLGTRPPAPQILGCRTLEEWNDFLIV